MNRCAATIPHRREAFSLLEMSLVMFLLAIIAALGISRYANSLSYYRADMASKRIAADLAMARNNAWVSGAGRTATFTTSTNTYSLSGIAGLDKAASAYNVCLADSPYSCQILSVNFQGQPSVTFDGYGAPNRGGQVIVQAGAFQKTVSLDGNSGNVSVQ